MPRRRTDNATRVLHNLLRYGPATCDEIQVSTGLPHQCASARCADLLRRGVIRATGNTRKTRLGRPARVLEVVR